MVLMRRQNSTPVQETADYSCYDSPMVGSFQHSKSERSYFDDPELRNIPDFVSPAGKGSSKTSKPVVNKLFLAFQYLAFAAMMYNVWTTSGDLAKTTSELANVNLDYENLRETLDETEIELRNAHHDFTRLQMNVNHAQPMAALGNGVTSSEERKAVADTILGRHDAQADRMVLLQKGIQEMHRLELLEKYGPGPYEIEVSVLVGNNRKFFTIQTAPIDKMPHSIHSFLDMVENKVWDDTMFIHKVEHVVLAAPIDSEGKTKHPEITKKLLFPEYSEDFPHVQFTIGFQGRPGGPEIYINLDDNRDYHGPGGQLQHDLVEEADPCFGIITHGRDVLREFQNLNAKATELDEVFYSRIEFMKIVRNKSSTV